MSSLDETLGSHNYAHARLTGKRSLDLTDLQLICEEIGVSPIEMLRRARQSAAQADAEVVEISARSGPDFSGMAARRSRKVQEEPNMDW